MSKPLPTVSQILSDPRFAQTARLFQELNKRWTPHAGQIAAGEHIFRRGARRLFIENGRKWGKTEFACDVVWRLGNMIQNGQGYYFGAYQKAVREFLWAPERIQKHGPAEYVRDIHKTEMRLTFTSGTFVKLDGADEFRGSKGFNPDFVILDEFADYPEDFWFAMSPNFMSKDTIVVIISSPPWELESEPGQPVLFCRIADLWKKRMNEAIKAGKRPRQVYINAPSRENPHLPAGYLEEEREDLIAMGLEDVWQREYEAKRVLGGGKRVIPTFDRNIHMHPHDEVMARIEKDRQQLLWFNVSDPGNSTVFATLFMAVNPYTKEVYFLDEDYEKSEENTTEHILWPRFKEKEDELYPSEEEERFTRVYDEEAKWWAVGVNNDFGVAYIPTEKATNSREFGLSLLRSIFRYKKAFVSDRCHWFIWELENWRKDKRGQIPKINDHLIDCARYGLHAADYFLTREEMDKPLPVHPREQRRQIAASDPHQELEEMAEALFGSTDLDHLAGRFDNLDTGEYDA